MGLTRRLPPEQEHGMEPEEPDAAYDPRPADAPQIAAPFRSAAAEEPAWVSGAVPAMFGGRPDPFSAMPFAGVARNDPERRPASDPWEWAGAAAGDLWGSTSWQSQTDVQAASLPGGGRQSGPSSWPSLPVQRQQVALADESRPEMEPLGAAPTSAATRTSEPPDDGAAPPNVDLLARQVYAVIKQRLKVERERAGMMGRFGR